ncbi:b260594d-2996-45dc-9084-60cbc70155b4 [Sclerotinia trifoliorum]|uniref:B260594d-2996-45dc-9084-60cbc70155b4 n=1 Tax=Sclerotinia trifoliorum TaxID=28548 RepID=A0A8H2ZPW5_9HELO|nr:b260594d-2996-45dc-9084-60cbc70155b4 [Sclerotinia trifoliorum]
MSGALSLLAELEKDTNKAAPSRKNSQSKPRTGRSAANSRSSSVQSRGPSQTRSPISAPAPPQIPPQNITPRRTTQSTNVTPRTSFDRGTERSRSQGPDSRRVSFADAPRPQTRTLMIPTKESVLSSGFPYNPKLNKYGVTEHEWSQFTKEILDTLPSSKSFSWRWKRGKIIAIIKRDLQYESPLKSALRQWNKGFRRRGFSVYLEIPVEKDLTDDEVSGDTKEEKKQAKKDAKKFRFLIGAANSSSSSVYSRTSLAESVSRESHVKAVIISHEDEEQITQKFPQAEVEGTSDGTTEDGSNEEESSAEKAAVILPSTETIDNAPDPLPVA